MKRFQFGIGTIMIVVAATGVVIGLTRVALSLPPEYYFFLIFIAMAVGASVLGGTAELAVIWYRSRSPRRLENGVSMHKGQTRIEAEPKREAKEVSVKNGGP
jgi:hypothetical protein